MTAALSHLSDPYRSIGGVRELRHGRLLVLTIHRATGWCYVDGCRVEGLALIYGGTVALLRTQGQHGAGQFLVRARHYWRLVHGDLAA